MAVRILVFAKIKPGEEQAFEDAYAEVTRKVKGTPGHVCDELLRDTGEKGSYILLAEWESRERFLEWENDPVHMATTTPMRPYWSGRVERRIYEVAHRIDSR
jgi:heme-degrading monooxygenase HmoA